MVVVTILHNVGNTMELLCVEKSTLELDPMSYLLGEVECGVGVEFGSGLWYKKFKPKVHLIRRKIIRAI
ncbi:hypothetical protein VNO78_31053 [Psophocarpus tetragonolobus]|uniref:Uncharacterized protein n=1 Tax=Psophocarpus tetragonolobus TaxID=3891 RepID=A0AAN9RXW8_PSOTE